MINYSKIKLSQLYWRLKQLHQHDFKVQTSWQGGRNNVGNVQGDILSENISIPASLGGVGIGTNR